MCFTLEEIKHRSVPVAQKYGVKRLGLFGSYARGEATQESDVDLRIDKGTIRGLRFAGLLGDLEDALGKHVDLISTGGMDEAFRRSIAREEVLLYERQ